MITGFCRRYAVFGSYCDLVCRTILF